MNILLTGASGFVGAHLAKYLAKSHTVWGCYFSTPLQFAGVHPLRVDLRNKRALLRLRDLSIDVVVHVACKIKARPVAGETPAEAAHRENSDLMTTVLSLGKPVVYASSTVVHWQRDIPYVLSRREDEARLVSSGLPYAILRPSAPYGPKHFHHQPRHRESFHTLTWLVRHFPFVPRIGSGEYRRQPVHVTDFAKAISALITAPLPNKAFDVGGATAHKFNDIIRIIGEACRKKPKPVTIPKWGMVKIAQYLPDFDPSLLDAIDEDELADPTALQAHTNLNFRSFEVGVLDLLR